jgi:hypothetical protein
MTLNEDVGLRFSSVTPNAKVFQVLRHIWRVYALTVMNVNLAYFSTAPLAATFRFRRKLEPQRVGSRLHLLRSLSAEAHLSADLRIAQSGQPQFETLE